MACKRVNQDVGATRSSTTHKKMNTGSNLSVQLSSISMVVKHAQQLDENISKVLSIIKGQDGSTEYGLISEGLYIWRWLKQTMLQIETIVQKAEMSGILVNQQVKVEEATLEEWLMQCWSKAKVLQKLLGLFRVNLFDIQKELDYFTRPLDLLNNGTTKLESMYLLVLQDVEKQAELLKKQESGATENSISNLEEIGGMVTQIKTQLSSMTSTDGSNTMTSLKSQIDIPTRSPLKAASLNFERVIAI